VRVTQDDCPSISVSRLRALGEVTEDMGSVHVAIAGVGARCGFRICVFPTAGAGRFFSVLSAGGAREFSNCSRGSHAGAAPAPGSPRGGCSIALSRGTRRSGLSG
jgi:hypothetical protein